MVTDHRPSNYWLSQGEKIKFCQWIDCSRVATSHVSSCLYLIMMIGSPVCSPSSSCNELGKVPYV